MAVIEIAKIQVRRGQENQTGIPTLAGGEFGWAADTEHLYIGLRRDDGGARDANVRILTENDLLPTENIFNAPEIADYTYRADTDPPITADIDTGLAVVRDINKKLDDFVNIRDFGVVGEGGNANEVLAIQNAIDKLFLDPLKDGVVYGKYSAKVLYFPAGVYNIDQPLLLPAYTTIVGEGIGKTIINLIALDDSHALITRDADINDLNGSNVTFDTITMSSGSAQPNYIHIEGLTIQYDPLLSGVQACRPLVSLDCAENAIFRDVRFAGNHVIGDTIDNVNGGHSGIQLRGYPSSENLTVSSNNVLIDNCEFDGLYYCIRSNYDIVNPVIQNCQFYNSIRGITFNDTVDPAANTGPRGARILNNRFMKIEEQAIYVGVSGVVGLETHHISMNNRFYHVGNKQWNRDSTTGTSVITYLTDGNVTVNDWFDRQEYQNQNFGAAIRYNPLVQGRATINNPGVNTVVINTVGSITTPVLRLPITSLAQHLSIEYNMTQGVPGNYTVDRIGKLDVYVQPGQNPTNTETIGDAYTYNNGDANINWTMTVDAAYAYFEINVSTLSDYSTNPITLKYQTNLMV
jgi:hypothetical protein